MAADILHKIVQARRERVVTADGKTQGLDLPMDRGAVPISPFPGPVICEIKRRSPSRGNIDMDINPVERAGRYLAAGAGSVSVLTEEEFFGGSLADLMAVKRAFPELAVLRKDFLLDEEDIEVSWRAGADAVLLIAAILEPKELERMHHRATELGLAALVEVHDRDELRKIAPLRPPLLGINSRDLRTFRVDLLGPLALAARIDWECVRVFESGIFHPEDVRLARDGDFSSVLVGESVVREPGRVGDLVAEFSRDGGGASPGGGFWNDIAVRREAIRADDLRRSRPLVKICGITSVEDALLAQELGADLLGLIYADSPRTAPPDLAARLRDGGVTIPLVGVVVEAGDADNEQTSLTAARNEELCASAQRDLQVGVLDALQLHGASGPREALTYGWPVYKALRFSAPDSVHRVVEELRTPRFLIDTYNPRIAGGTGVTVEAEIMSAVKGALANRPHGALWLAGGLNPDTVGAAIVRWQPELIDASSGLESEPGKKNPQRLKDYFAAIDAAVYETDGAVKGSAKEMKR